LMMSLWAPTNEILCVHPRSAALVGYQAIQQGWAQIFAGGPIQIEAPLLHSHQDDHIAWHGIEERLTQVRGGLVTTLFASHLYVKTQEGWRLHLHHASPSAPIGSDAAKLH
jgi:ketosteroid isomerase-like protein